MSRVKFKSIRMDDDHVIRIIKDLDSKRITIEIRKRCKFKIFLIKELNLFYWDSMMTVDIGFEEGGISSIPFSISGYVEYWDPKVFNLNQRIAEIWDRYISTIEGVKKIENALNEAFEKVGNIETKSGCKENK